MTSLLAISGSPSADSRTALLTGHVLQRLARAGYQAGHLRVRDLPATELLAGRTDGPALRPTLDAVAAADGLVVATPVYKAAYTGLLKAFFDLLPQTGLAGKTVLPLMTGGSVAHALAIDYALRPVLSALGARHIVAGTFVLDKAVEPGVGGTLHVHPEAESRLDRAVGEFTAALPCREGRGAASPAPGEAVHEAANDRA